MRRFVCLVVLSAAVYAAAATSPALPSSAAIGTDALAAAKEIFIKHGCPYNLDKACIRGPKGKLIKCRCVS